MNTTTARLAAIAAIGVGALIAVSPSPNTAPQRDAAPVPFPAVHHGGADTHEAITAIPQDSAYQLPATPSNGLHTGP